MIDTTTLISADHICSEFYFQLHKRNGKFVKRNMVYVNIKDKQPKVWLNFEKLAELCNKYKIDHRKYIEFYFNHSSKQLSGDLINIKWFRLYAENLKLSDQYRNIYSAVLKTCDFIADECIQLNLNSTVDYIKHLVITDQLALKVFSGNISKYWLASIKQLGILTEKLPTLSQSTLEKIVKNRQLYYNELQEAFRLLTGKRCRPFFMTDKKIEELIEKQNR
jgi:hypothetical protein